MGKLQTLAWLACTAATLVLLVWAIDYRLNLQSSPFEPLPPVWVASAAR